MRRSLLTSAALAIAMFAVIAPAAGADEYDLIVLQDEVPSADQFIDALKPSPEGAGLKLRGLRRRPADAGGGEGSSDSQPRRAVAFRIEFEFDSFELTAPARRALDNLAIALDTLDLRGERYLLEGHTDSVGGENYNLQLSSLRAAATKKYLTTKHGIASHRLATVGRGESRLLDPRQPSSAINRRVQIVSESTR